MIKEAIILAGGFGTRLQSVVSDLPKSMAPVNGKPFLEYVFDYLELYSVKKVILAVGYKHEAIEEHFKKRFKYINVSYSVEEEPLGTGGAIKKAFSQVEGKQAIVMNGDTMYRVNLGKLYDFQLIHKSKMTIALREVKDTSRYGTVILNERAQITDFVEKGQATGPGLINGGLYAINKEFLESLELPEKFSMEKDCFEAIHKKQVLFGMKCNQFFLDIGIPEDYNKAQDEFRIFEF
jgi:D-glycero-alpha-D-manno-heptose 1-phosphate guanylyltransferase